MFSTKKYDNSKRNVAPNQHIRMISEGSCDIEDWLNDCWLLLFIITVIRLSHAEKAITELDNGLQYLMFK